MDFFIPCWISLINLFPIAPTQSQIESIIPQIPSLLEKCELTAQESKPKALQAIIRLSNKPSNPFVLRLTDALENTTTPSLYASCSDVGNPSCNTDFAACWFLLAKPPLFNKKLHISYVKKVISTVPQRLQTCLAITKEAYRQNVDPLLAITLGFKETTFLNIKSNQNAVGPLGTIMKYHCRQKDKKLCDPIEVGVSTIQKYLDLNPYDMCTALAKYNAGECGTCDIPKEGEVSILCRDSQKNPKWRLFEKSRYYALDVIQMYENLCMLFAGCHTC